MPRLDHVMQELFDRDTIARGEAYAENDHVAQVLLRDGRLRAVVTGSEDYDLTVDLAGLNRGPDGIAVDGLDHHCSCPLGGDCKHVVAALIVWARDEGVELHLHPPAPIAGNGTGADAGVAAANEPFAHLLTRPWLGTHEQQQWLNRLTSFSHEPAASPEQRLLFVLTATPGSGIEVDVVLSRTLKNGRAGVGKRFHSITNLLARPPAGMDTGDRALLAAVSGESRLVSLWQKDCLWSAELLQRLVATGRAVWNEVGGSFVRLLPERHGVPSWQQQGGKVRLSLVDDDGRPIEVLPTTPPWYRTPEGVGPLSSTLDAVWIARLAAMPWLEPVMATASLSSLPPGIPPPPLGQEPLTPVPWLHRSQTTLAFWARDRQGTNRLEAEVVTAGFRYGDDEVGEGGPPLLKRADGSVLVRNVAAEQARLAELDRLGLVPWPPIELTRVGTPHLPSVRQRTVRGIGRRDAPPSPAIPPSTLAALLGSGWQIRGADVPTVAVHDLTRVSARIEDHQDGGWFELHLGIDLDGQRIDLVPLLTPLLRGGPLEWQKLPRAGGLPPAVLATCGDHAVVRVPLDLLADLHAKLVELFDAPAGPGGGWRIDPMRGDLLDAFDRLSPHWLGGERLRALAQRLASCLAPPAVAAPPGLTATLRPYQLQGLAWMRRLRELNIGGILADDMGLGKTVQAIAHLVSEHAAVGVVRASLVVCPASVVGVWRDELARFAPALPVCVLHGAGRSRVSGEERGVVITSYATLARDIEAFAAVRWQVAIADEAQAFKNTGTAINAAMRRVDAHQRLCLTGTPVENHLGELHALLNWAAPGILGGGTAFARTFRTPIEDAGDRDRAALLRRRTAPFLLRRTKAAVAGDLPPRTDIDLPVELGPAQRRLYEAIRLTMDDRVRAAVADRGLARSGLTVLEALLRLRQVCCDPRLLPGTLAGTLSESAKLDALGELLTTLVEEKRQVLVFSQFTSLLDLVAEQVLGPANIASLRLDGRSRNRADLVARFQAGEAPVFLLSLKAGGTGLTLTAADTVVLLDPWWNPAVERQAADRAHRIGQSRAVTIYRLVAANTVESRIRSLQGSKTALADALLDESGQSLGQLDLADIEALLAPVDGD